MKYILVTIILIAVITLYYFLAKYLNIVDQPNNRSSHRKVTVRGGGIIFPIGVLLWFLICGFEYPKFLFGLTLLSVISFLDDIVHLSVFPRLIFQIISILFLFSEVGFEQFPWWIWFMGLIVITSILNAYNFMDGINGITAGYSLSVISGLWLVNTYQQQYIDNDFIYFVAISLIIFSFFNFKKNAILFAGDIGSMSIAFIIIFLLSKLIIQTGNFLYLLFISIYLIDSLLTIITRIWNKENIFEAHRKHVYQILANELIIPHIFISVAYSILQFGICFMIFVLLNKDSTSFDNWIIACSTLFLLILIWIYIRSKINMDQINKQPKLLLKK